MDLWRGQEGGQRVSDERRKHFGAYIARWRREVRLSQRQLAERLCTLSGVPTLTRSEVSRWERGERIPAGWLPLLAQGLSTALPDLERAASYARGEPSPDGALSPAETLAALLPLDEELGTPGEAVRRRIDPGTVERLAARVHGLRLADDVLAGGDLIGPAMRELRATVRLYRETSHSEVTGRALLAQIGELAQIAGWIASDAGEHRQAERAYRLGISAARAASDSALVGNLAGSLAYQYANSGRADEGVQLARAAAEESGREVHPRAQALLLDRIAWAHTRAGQPQPAMRALAEAHDALGKESAQEIPSWAYWVSEDELRVMDARVFTELHRPLRAVPLLTDVLSQYDTTHAREMALYLSWLVVALADANEPEEAAAAALKVLELSDRVASDRAAERSRVVLRHLRLFGDVPEIRALLDEYGHLLTA